MNNKFILVSSAVILSSIGLFSFLKQNEVVQTYQPRSASHIVGKGFTEGGKEGRLAAEYVKWRHSILADQRTGMIDPKVVNKVAAEVEKLGKYQREAAIQWDELGPDNVGGRTRSILIDRNDNKILYAGSVGGGLFKSTTAGASWQRVSANSDMLENLAISSLAQTPNGDIYYATGEESFSSGNGTGNSGVQGGGVFKSTDGSNFSRLASTNPATTGNSRWYQTNSIAADPNTNRLYAGNLTGLYVTVDGGATWTKPATNPSSSSNCTEIKVSSNGQTVLAVLGTNLYLSTDGGVNFNRLTINYGGTAGRVSIAISPSNDNYLYCMASNNANGRILGIFQSKDKGGNWTKIGSGGSPYFDPLSNSLQGQGTWNNVIAVDPTDPAHIFAAGVEFWEWYETTGWKKYITQGAQSPLNPFYLHADNHAIIFDTKTNPITMYVGNDGGVYKSTTMGRTFVPSNFGYNVTQFYAVAANPWGTVLGGTQDNGTQLINGKGNTPKSAVEIFGGDGFYVEASQKNPNYMFYGTYDTEVQRSQNAGATALAFKDARFDKFTEDTNQFNTPYQLYEAKDTSDTLNYFVAATRFYVWMCFDPYSDFSKLPNWYRIAPVNGNCTSLDISPDGNTIFVGTSAGTLYRINGIRTAAYDSVAGLAGGLKIDAIFGQSNRIVTGIAVNNSNPNQLVVTYGNYNNNNYVFRSNNVMDTIVANVAFTTIQGNLPKFPVYDVEIHDKTPGTILLATEYGIYGTVNGQATTPTWTEENQGMARVATFMIRQYSNNPFTGPKFYLATHGRGFYSTNSFLTGINKIERDNTLVAVYPNPAFDKTTLKFETGKTGNAEISVIDIQGKQVFNTTVSNSFGTSEVTINTSSFKAGTYFVSIQADGKASYSKFVVIK